MKRAVAAVLLLLSGCGATTVDAGKAESVLRKTVPGVSQAVCPTGVKPRAGITFVCALEFKDGRRAKLRMHVRDTKGTVDYGPADLRIAPR